MTTSRVLQSNPSAPNARFARAIADLWEGLRRHDLWMMLGWQDIRQRYSRSVLGPAWMSLYLGLMVVGIGYFYAEIFGERLNAYLPFLTFGFVVWTFISGLLIDSTMTFIASENVIRQISVPLSVFVYRVVWRHLIILGHNVWICVAVAVIFGVWPGAAGLMALPGLVLICLNGIWACLLLGAASARFRDIPQFVGHVMPVIFLLTPVLWSAEQGRHLAHILVFNPFYHFVEIVRMPLLGGAAPTVSWLVAIAITVVGWLVTLAFFSRYRWRIAYWL